MENIITTSARQTFNLAKRFAKKLKGGEVICLIGELGAGKTIFTKGLAAGLGIKKNITSPTFVLMKVHKAKSQKSKVKSFVHIDAYRLKSVKDILAIGVEEYFGRPDTITVIEWADKIYSTPFKRSKLLNYNFQIPKWHRIKEIWLSNLKLIYFKNINGNQRKIIIKKQL